MYCCNNHVAASKDYFGDLLCVVVEGIVNKTKQMIPDNWTAESPARPDLEHQKKRSSTKKNL